MRYPQPGDSFGGPPRPQRKRTSDAARPSCAGPMADQIAEVKESGPPGSNGQQSPEQPHLHLSALIVQCSKVPIFLSLRTSSSFRSLKHPQPSQHRRSPDGAPQAAAGWRDTGRLTPGPARTLRFEPGCASGVDLCSGGASRRSAARRRPPRLHADRQRLRPRFRLVQRRRGARICGPVPRAAARQQLQSLLQLVRARGF
jgi:hypothetical protein